MNRDVDKMTQAEFDEALRQIEAAILRAKDDLENFVPYQRPAARDVAEPEPRVVRVIHFRVSRSLLLGAAITLLVGLILSISASEAKAAESWPCTGNGMSAACTRCVVTTPAGEGQCQSMNLAMFDESPLMRRNAIMRGKGNVAGVIEHQDGPWATTQAQIDENNNLGAEVEQETPTEDTVIPASVNLSTPGEGWAPNQSNVFLAMLVLAGALAVAVKKFAPEKAAAATAFAKAHQQSVLPYAKDAGRGARKFGPVIRWFMDANDFGTVVFKMITLVIGIFLITQIASGVPTLVAVAVIAIGLITMGRVGDHSAIGHDFTESRVITNALITAGVIKKGKPGDRSVIAQVIGDPVITRFGVTIKVDLPAGVTIEQVRKKQGPLAAALRLPSARLEITQGVADPEGVITVWRGAPAVPITPITLPVTSTFLDGVPIGTSPKGERVIAVTREQQTLIGGMPGMGKTGVCRKFIVHALTDPLGRAFVIDGKGNTDYVAGEKAYTAYAHANQDDLITNVESILTAVHKVVNDHNNGVARNRGPVLLVLDEWQDIRAEADKTTRDRLDALLGRIVRKGRAPNVHVLMATQRTSEKDLPTGTRSMFQQQLGLKVRDETDYRMIFGGRLLVAAPSGRGQAVLQSLSGQVLVQLDHVTDQAWEEAAGGFSEREHIALAEVKVVPPLAAAVLAYLEANGDSTPAAVLSGLDPALAPGSAAALGKALSKFGISAKAVGRERLLLLKEVEAAVELL